MKRGVFIFVLISLLVNVSAITVTGDSITGKASSQQTNVSIIILSLPANISIFRPENKTYIINESLIMNYSSTGLTTWYNLDNSNNYTLSDSSTISTSEGAHVVYFYSNNSDNNVTSASNDFYINTTLLILFYEEYKGNGRTSDLEQVAYEDLQKLNNIILENSYGKMQFNEIVNVTADSNFSDRNVDLDSHTNISFNRIELSSEYLPNFNKQATLWLYNLTYSNPQVLKDGSNCTTCRIESFSSGVLKFNVSGFSVYSASETPTPQTPSPETPSGGGGGGGSTLEVPLVEVEFPFPEGLFVNKNGITLTIKQGDMEVEEIVIDNTGKKIVKVKVYALNITKFVQINESDFEIGEEESYNILLEFLIPEDLLPDIYLGKIVVEVGDEVYEIPVSINVLSKTPDFEVKTKIKKEYLETDPGEEIEGIIEVDSFNEGKYDVTLEYGILDSSGGIIFIRTELIGVEDFLELQKKLEVPSDLKPGSYLFYAKVRGGDNVYSSSSWFYVKEKSPLPYVIVGCFIIGGVILYLLFFRKKKPKEGKKLKEKGKMPLKK